MLAAMQMLHVPAYRSRPPAPLIPAKMIDAAMVNGSWKRLVPVDRGAADAEGPGDRGAADAAGPARPGRRQLVRVHHGGAAAGAALSLRRGQGWPWCARC